MAEAVSHTPGPWAAKTSRVISHIASRATANGDIMVYDKQIAWTQPVGDEAVRAANARLIAAAPDLLAALQWLADSITFRDHGGQKALAMLEVDVDEAHASARAAIARATGTSA